MFKTVIVPVVDGMVTPKIMKQISSLLGASGGEVVLTYISDPRAPFIYTRKASDYKISDAKSQEGMRTACKRVARESF